MFFKRIVPILLVIFITFVCSINAEDHVTTEKKPECDCDTVNDFVCATNNVTYRNECVLKKCVTQYNPDIKFLHKGHCKGDIIDEEQTVKSEDKRQRRAVNRRKPKQVHGVHQRKSLLSKRLKHKPVIAKLSVPKRARRKLVGKLKRPLHGKVNRKHRTKYRAAHASKG